MRHFRSLTIFSLLLSSTLFVACEKDKKDKASIETPEPEIIEVGSNSAGIINVNISSADDGYSLSLGDVPDGGTLECELNGALLPECFEGMKFKASSPGDQILQVRSVNSGNILSIGEVRFYYEIVSGSAESGSAPSISSAHPLSITFKDDAFRNGSAVTKNKGIEFSFAPFTKPPCEKPTLRCRYDRLDSPFWPSCTDVLGHKISKERMALGLQYLSVRAECGDQVGPHLDIYWYGVKDTYQPLAIEAISLSSKTSVLRLQKANDCPREWLTFECQSSLNDQFKRCDSAVESRKLVVGFAARANCRDQKGPVLIR